MTDIIEITKKHWENSDNCARSTAKGILDYFQFFEISKTLDKALMAFGGGMGERSICGAVSGSLTALSTIMVERGIEAEKMSEIFKEFKTRFQEKNGSLYCKNIIEDFIAPDGSIDQENQERKDKCEQAVFSAVLIAKNLIEKL